MAELESVNSGNFPVGPVVKTPYFHWRGQGFNACQELRSSVSRGVAKNNRDLKCEQ